MSHKELELEELEREEGLRQAETEIAEENDGDSEKLTPEEKKSLLIKQYRMKRNAFAIKRLPRRSISMTMRGQKRERSPETTTADGGGGGGEDGHGMVIDGDMPSKKRQCLSRSVSRSMCLEVVPGEGLRDSAQKKMAIKIARKSLKKRNKEARRGEGDRVIPDLKPKHLYAGKRSNGKTQRR